MVTIPPAKRPSQRRKIRPATVSPPPAALSLVAATYDPVGLTLTLQFNRPIDVSGLSGGEIQVDDGTNHHQSYLATGDVPVVDDRTVQIGLEVMTGYGGAGVSLTALADNGIVAADGSGLAWAGVSALALPFP